MILPSSCAAKPSIALAAELPRSLSSCAFKAAPALGLFLTRAVLPRPADGGVYPTPAPGLNP